MQAGRDLDAALERARDGAEIGVHRVNALRSVAVGRSNFQVVVGVDALDDEHLAVLFDLAAGLGDQATPHRPVILRASSAPPKVPVSQPAAAATT